MVKQTAGKEKLGDFAPKFAEINDDILFGEIWSREDKLSLRDRSLITICIFMGKGLVDNSLRYHLIKAFFEEFDEESSISIKGNDAEMKIHFRDVPLKIIDALGYCKIDELNYNSNANKNNKAVAVEVKSNDSKPETSENKRKTIKVKRRRRAKKKKAIAADIVKIPELDDIAEK